MTNTTDYKILYTHFKTDTEYTHYCDDGFLREGVVNEDIYSISLPQWNSFSHSGMMTKSEKNDLLNYVSQQKYGIYLYWMIWLYKSPELFDKLSVKSDSVLDKDEIDYKKEFNDLYQEFEILEYNYDTLKASYDYLRKIYNDSRIEQDLGTEHD